MKNMFLYCLTFLAVLLPFLWFLVLSDRDTAEERKKSHDALPPIFRLCGIPARFLDMLGIGSLIRGIFPSSAKKLQANILYAGMEGLTAELVYCTQVFLLFFRAAAAAALAWMILPEDEQLGIPIAAAVGAFVAWFIPGIAVDNRVQQRKTMILQALPFSIDLICSAMRGGLDFMAAIRFYVHLGIPGPLTDEFSVMLREMKLGVLRTEALQNMAERIQLKEFTSFTSAIVMGTELGASLTDTMEIQGEEMRKLRFSIAECKAQRAPSLMLIPMALFILPAVFIVILTPVFLKMKEAGVPLF